MKLHITLSLFLLIGTVCRGEDKNDTKLPKKIRELQLLIQGKNRTEAYKATLKILGSSARDVGSGFKIEQWDINGGVFTFHQATGPVFRDASGVVTWLVKTTNELESNLQNSFEMTSLAEQDPNKIGMRYWLGNLQLNPSGGYKYQDSGQHSEHKKLFPRHFFADHPTGTYKIVYSKNIKGTDALEDIADETEVCKLTFSSGKVSKSFGITTYKSSRSLHFKSDNNVFEMDRGWSNYWADKTPKQNKSQQTNR